jgi:hypothetical protein
MGAGWYPRFAPPYRDVEELLAGRGVEVDHATVYRWVLRFTPLLAQVARPCRHVVGDRWRVDETYVKVAGRWRFDTTPTGRNRPALGHFVMVNRRCVALGVSIVRVLCSSIRSRPKSSNKRTPSPSRTGTR